MPILDIEIVGDLEREREVPLARELADAAGALFETGPGRTWVRIRMLSARHYAENGIPEPPKPVFVRVLRADPGSRDERRAEAPRIAELVAAITARPVENVHVLYEPGAAGRVAFGGTLVE